MTQSSQSGIDGGWQPIETAPFQTVIEVRNPVMAKAGDAVLATRGYMTDAGAHPDSTFCTSVFTPDKSGSRWLAFPAGRLVCPTEWRLPLPPQTEGGTE